MATASLDVLAVQDDDDGILPTQRRVAQGGAAAGSTPSRPGRKAATNARSRIASARYFCHYLHGSMNMRPCGNNIDYR